MKSIKDVKASLSSERRARIEKRSTETIAQIKALQELRKKKNVTQLKMAELLRIAQSGVSRIESRNDVLLSTLKNYVEVLGGHLRITVAFPDSQEIELLGINEG
jgi:transcriptional regulator with XRE-family HTH domain